MKHSRPPIYQDAFSSGAYDKNELQARHRAFVIGDKITGWGWNGPLEVQTTRDIQAAQETQGVYLTRSGLVK